MQTIQITLEYDGTNYQGFDRKNSTHTISYKLSSAIQRFTGEMVELHPAVRTETGVHAKIQLISFSLKNTVNLPHLMSSLNQALPQDIAIRKIEQVEDQFRSSLGVESCTYMCVIDIAEVPDVFQLNFAYHTGPELDIVSMKQAAAHFVGTHDFSSFTTGKVKKNPIKTISELTLTSSEDNTKLYLFITANNFLRAMPQAICGTLIQAGRRTLQPTQIQEIFDGTRRIDFLCPSKSLHLTDISYLA